MKHLKTAVAVVAAIAMSAVVYAASFSGKVSAVDPTAMSVAAANPNGSATIFWTAKTAFTVGGKPATSAALAVGDMISATYTADKTGKKTASAIAITKAP